MDDTRSRDDEGRKSENETREGGLRQRQAALQEKLYRGGLTAAEQLRLPAALEAEGLREEIAALRVRLETVFGKRPEDLKLVLYGMNTLMRMVVADYRLSPRASKELSDNVAAVLNSFADQLVPSDR